MLQFVRRFQKPQGKYGIEEQGNSNAIPGAECCIGGFSHSVRDILGAHFIGAYLQGSFAVGDFDIHSDVDFIIVIEEELSEEQVRVLQEMHERIYCLESPWAQHLEGSYFPKDILRYHTRCGSKLWYLDNGARSLPVDFENTLNFVKYIIEESTQYMAQRASL